MTSHALKADLGAVPYAVGRARRRSDRRTPQDRVEGTSLARLLGVAVLGWFGLMMVVAVLAF